MKFILILLLTVTSFHSLAQKKTTPKKTVVTKKATPAKKTAKVDDAIVKAMADEMCACFKPIGDSLHPLFLTFIKETIELGEKKAEANLGKAVSELSPEEQDAFMKSSEKLNGENSPFDKCMTEVTDKYKEKLQNIPNAEEIYLKAILKYLDTNADCKTFTLFLKLGLRGSEKKK